MLECNTILSANTKYRHLGWYCTRPTNSSLIVYILPNGKILERSKYKRLADHNKKSFTILKSQFDEKEKMQITNIFTFSHNVL